MGPRVLVLEDDADDRHHIVQGLSACWPDADVVLAERLALAVTLLTSLKGSWGGFIIDIVLPDGSGLDFARQVRERLPNVPPLICSGTDSRGHRRLAQRLGCFFLPKPLPCEAFGAYRCRMTEVDGAKPIAVTPQQLGNARLDTLVARITSAHGLTHREHQLLRLALDGHSSARLQEELRCSESTYATTARHVLAKAGDGQHRNLRSLVHHLLRSELQDASAFAFDALTHSALGPRDPN